MGRDCVSFVWWCECERKVQDVLAQGFIKFKNSRSLFNLSGVRMVTLNMFQTEDPKILGATVKSGHLGNFVPRICAVLACPYIKRH
jgi:hypothetical protein